VTNAGTTRCGAKTVSSGGVELMCALVTGHQSKHEGTSKGLTMRWDDPGPARRTFESGSDRFTGPRPL